MERRDFLKGIFGAAVVAAMPSIIVKQIEELPKPQIIIPSRLHEEDKVGKVILSNGLLYIWDDEKNILIGASDRFSLDFKQDFIDIGFSDSLYPQYIRGQRSWNISASNIQWVNNPRESFEENKKLRCLIAKDNIRINSEMYITQLDLTASQLGYIGSSAEFEGNGALIVEVNE